jgi:hypothetical protein
MRGDWGACRRNVGSKETRLLMPTAKPENQRLRCDTGRRRQLARGLDGPAEVVLDGLGGSAVALSALLLTGSRGSRPG